MKSCFLLLILLFISYQGFAQDSLQIISIHDTLGQEVDSLEKRRYRLFPYYSSKDFHSAQLFLMSDSSYILRVTMKDDSIQNRPMGKKELTATTNRINSMIGVYDKDSVRQSREKKLKKVLFFSVVLPGFFTILPFVIVEVAGICLVGCGI